MEEVCNSKRDMFTDGLIASSDSESFHSALKRYLKKVPGGLKLVTVLLEVTLMMTDKACDYVSRLPASVVENAPMMQRAVKAGLGEGPARAIAELLKQLTNYNAVKIN
jgi:hypothetical protein